jgi:hypothetical protein
VADALDREQEVAEVVLAQPARRIVGQQVSEHVRIDEQRQPQLALDLADQQLLARPARRDQRVAQLVADDEVADLDAGVDAVQALQATLDPAERHYWITLLPGSTISPACLSFFSTQASRVRSQIS